MRALIVEDEAKMATLIRRGLLEEGYAADIAAHGHDAVWMAGAADYDVIILDVMLPGLDGFEVCRRLRASEVWAPVLMLTARDGVEDRVAGSTPGRTTISRSRFRSSSSSPGFARSSGGEARRGP